jgi:pimeloyl-ACP methyl ester carboxylesterase
MLDRYTRQLSDLHGLARLGVDATAGVTDLVEAMHAAIARPDLGLRSSAPERTTGITGLVFRSIRGVTGLTGNVIDTMLAQDTITHPRTSAQREAIVAALNGVLGDHLAATGNPLALPMRLHHAGKPLALGTDALTDALTDAIPNPGPKLVVLVHGLCMNDLQWTRDGHDHGRMLAESLGYTPLYLHYNTGLSIAANGQRFAESLQQMFEAWPIPVEEIALIGHSMGGLLARSACHYAAIHGHTWPAALRHLVCMGSPHRSNAAATGSTSSSALRRSPHHWRESAKSAAPASPICAMAMRCPRASGIARCRCPKACAAMRWPRRPAVDAATSRTAGSATAWCPSPARLAIIRIRSVRSDSRKPGNGSVTT